MKDWGTGLILLGLLAIAGAFFMDVSVTTSTPDLSAFGGGGSVTSSVVNLQKLQIQMMVFQAGLTSFVAGVVLFAAGGLRITKVEVPSATTSNFVSAPTSAPVVESSKLDAEVGPAFEPDEGPNREWLWVAIPAIVISLLVAAMSFCTPHSSTTAVDGALIQNAEAIADNLEMMADNVEAEANGL